MTPQKFQVRWFPEDTTRFVRASDADRPTMTPTPMVDAPRLRSACVGLRRVGLSSTAASSADTVTICPGALSPELINMRRSLSALDHPPNVNPPGIISTENPLARSALVASARAKARAADALASAQAMGYNKADTEAAIAAAIEEATICQQTAAAEPTIAK